MQKYISFEDSIKPFFGDSNASGHFVSANYEGNNYTKSINTENDTSIKGKLLESIIFAKNYKTKENGMNDNDVHNQFVDFIVRTALFHRDIDKPTNIGNIVHNLEQYFRDAAIQSLTKPYTNTTNGCNNMYGGGNKFPYGNINIINYGNIPDTNEIKIEITKKLYNFIKLITINATNNNFTHNNATSIHTLLNDINYIVNDINNNNDNTLLLNKYLYDKNILLNNIYKKYITTIRSDADTDTDTTSNDINNLTNYNIEKYINILLLNMNILNNQYIQSKILIDSLNISLNNSLNNSLNADYNFANNLMNIAYNFYNIIVIPIRKKIYTNF